jgi:hypothetical protein
VPKPQKKDRNADLFMDSSDDSTDEEVEEVKTPPKKKSKKKKKKQKKPESSDDEAPPSPLSVMRPSKDKDFCMDMTTDAHQWSKLYTLFSRAL